MNGATVMADVPPITPPASLLSSYNLSLSLNLTSILSMLPSSGSRLLARLRKGSFGTLLWDQVPASSTVEDAWTSTFAETAAAASSPTPRPTEMDDLSFFPGPWGFFTSWYMVGLLMMAVLLHRMQNIVLPSRIPARRSRHAYRFGPSFATPFHHRIIWTRFYSSLLPLDFSSTTTRLILHLPSTYYLGKMLLTWFCLVLQTSEIFPAFSEDVVARWAVLGWVNHFGMWCAQKEMSDICWQTFVAVCAAFLVEGFVRALAGLGTGFPIGGHDPNTSPFNLIGYAFLLHVYSSPVAHAYKPDDLPSRPDKHVIITITIPLLQLFIFHLLSVSKRLSTHRFFPTLLSSVLSLAHFHGTLLSHFFYRPSSLFNELKSSSMTTAILTSTTLASSSRSGTTLPRIATHLATATASAVTSIAIPHRLSPYAGMSLPTVKYPLLNYIPNILETFLLLIILLTVSFNALVQLLVLGRVERLFSGMAVSQGLHDDEQERGFIASLPLEEDWGVVLLRVGISSLEATGLRGWGNEVAPINMPWRKRGRGRRQVQTGSTPSESLPPHGAVRLGRAGVADVQYGYGPGVSVASGASARPAVQMHLERGDSSSTANPGLSRRKSTRNDLHTLNRGFFNEVRTVDLGNSEETDDGRDTHRPGGNHWRRTRRQGYWRYWAREMLNFLLALLGVLWGLVKLLIEKAKNLLTGSGAHHAQEKSRSRSRETEIDTIGKPVVGLNVDMTVESADEEERRRRKEKEVYERFLRGEEISDDDEDEDEDDDISSEGDEDESTFDEEEHAGREAEAIELFTDLLRNPGPPAGSSSSQSSEAGRRSSGEMVLAHLVHGDGNAGANSSPLTRRRWNALFNGGVGKKRSRRGSPGVWDEEADEDEVWEDTGVLENREQSDAGSGRGGQVQSTCVICTTEARDIICWPCRCLAMCDSCREALSSKSAPSKHRCPCCRQTVDGYSRIYIP
ncbi:hypothetical protein CPB84DRAFT_1761521 [Gymnopilus junonius]|uniref:RING-type domain-containing protein n=1 Tax=Gymnopilus junonius TaxID=109634 RepID=A0A9P5P1D7_GYMJU|nr:hypothetical protein CPB84DRAFT_1761521 [Gymnopilus junonius]